LHTGGAGVDLMIVGEKALERAGIRLALEERPNFSVVGETDAGRDILPLVDQTSPDVVLLDADMPGFGALTCLDRIRERHPDVDVIMLAGDADSAQLGSAFSHGAHGVILKTTDPLDLGLAVVQTLDIGFFVPCEAAYDDDDVVAPTI
jgi:DNA-binding NarL/FixJ family response regulator